MLNIVLLGPPGSGKGTQGELIGKKYGLYSISIGDVLRKEIKDKTNIGERIKGFINQGELIPDSLIVKIFTNSLEKINNNQGYIFDGFPRTIFQAKILDNILKKKNTDITAVFSFCIKKEELINRLLKRGNILNRGDDNLKTIQNRLIVYKKQTEPLQEFYKKKRKTY